MPNPSQPPRRNLLAKPAALSSKPLNLASLKPISSNQPKACTLPLLASCTQFASRFLANCVLAELQRRDDLPPIPQELGVGTLHKAMGSIPRAHTAALLAIVKNPSATHEELLRRVNEENLTQPLDRSEARQLATSFFTVSRALSLINIASVVDEFKTTLASVCFADVSRFAGKEFGNDENAFVHDAPPDLRHKLVWGWPSIRQGVKQLAKEISKTLIECGESNAVTRMHYASFSLMACAELRSVLLENIGTKQNQYFSSPTSRIIDAIAMCCFEDLFKTLCTPSERSDISNTAELLARFNWSKLFKNNRTGALAAVIDTCWDFDLFYSNLNLCLTEREHLGSVADRISGESWPHFPLSHHRPVTPVGFTGFMVQDSISKRWHFTVFDSAREMRSMCIVEPEFRGTLDKDRSWTGLCGSPIRLGYSGDQVTLGPDNGMLFFETQTFFPYYPRDASERVAHNLVVDELHWRTRVFDSFLCKEPRLVNIMNDPRGAFLIVSSDSTYLLSTPDKVHRQTNGAFLGALDESAGWSLCSQIGIRPEGQWKIFEVLTLRKKQTWQIPLEAPPTEEFDTAQKQERTLGEYHDRFGYLSIEEFAEIAQKFNVVRSDHDGQGRHPIYFNTVTGAQYTSSPNYNNDDTNFNRKLRQKLRLLDIPLAEFMDEAFARKETSH